MIVPGLKLLLVLICFAASVLPLEGMCIPGIPVPDWVIGYPQS